MSFLLGTQDGFSQFLGSRHPNKNLSRCLVLAHSMCSVSICWTKGFTETNSQGYKASTGLALRMIVEAETEIRARATPEVYLWSVHWENETGKGAGKAGCSLHQRFKSRELPAEGL